METKVLNILLFIYLLSNVNSKVLTETSVFPASAWAGQYTTAFSQCNSNSCCCPTGTQNVIAIAPSSIIFSGTGQGCGNTFNWNINNFSFASNQYTFTDATYNTQYTFAFDGVNLVMLNVKQARCSMILNRVGGAAVTAPAPAPALPPTNYQLPVTKDINLWLGLTTSNIQQVRVNVLASWHNQVHYVGGCTSGCCPELGSIATFVLDQIASTLTICSANWIGQCYRNSSPPNCFVMNISHFSNYKSALGTVGSQSWDITQDSYGLYNLVNNNGNGNDMNFQINFPHHYHVMITEVMGSAVTCPSTVPSWKL